MPVVGSYKDNVAFSRVRVRAMNRATLQESLEKLQELVRKHTPIGDTKQLWNSVDKREQGALRRGPVLHYQGIVFSDLEYAAAIEYGMSPQFIVPKTRQALKFEWNGVTVFAAHSNWPGYEGRHMFLKGKEEFERLHAERIAKNNARVWLGAVDAGRRTTVI